MRSWRMPMERELMEQIKIRIFASMDFSMRIAMQEFVKFANPVVKHGKKEFQLDLGRIKAEPLLCGSDVSNQADVIIDRTIHWNQFYRCWSQTAQNCLVPIANNSLTNDNLDKHSTYDLMARAMHPKDKFPKTVMLPDFAPWTAEQKAEQRWATEQSLIISNTKYGWHPEYRQTDWAKVKSTLERIEKFQGRRQELRQQFYPQYDYIRDVMERHFGNQYPVFLKKAFGGGGSDVYRIKSLEELYDAYDNKTNGRVFHIQEAVEGYDDFVRCMGIGPEVRPMRFQPDEPLHEHYSPEIMRLDPQIYDRIESYVKFVNSYHRWTYNSFECLIKDGVIHPIDFANACPDSDFTSLHTHFPWLICALVRWLSFVGATRHNLRVDTEQERYLKVLNDPEVPQEEKFEFHKKLSDKYFDTEKYREFVEKNFKDLNEKMIQFYDGHFMDILEFSIRYSSFPDHEKARFVDYYKHMMDTTWRPNAMEYLKTVIR